MNVTCDANVAEPERSHRRGRQPRWLVLAMIALLSVVAAATGLGPRPAFGGATPPAPLGTYVGQTGSGRWIILTASADMLNFSMSVADCQTGGGLSFTGQTPISTTFSVDGGDNPEYWMSGSFDGLGFGTGVVGMRRYDDDGNTSCEHEENWLVSLSTPAPTTMPTTSIATSTSTSTSTSSSTTTAASTTTLTSTTLATATSAPPTVATSTAPSTIGPATSAPPNSSPAVVPTTTAPAPTDPAVATSDPPGADPVLIATVADDEVTIGEPTTVQAVGFAPGERVTATLRFNWNQYPDFSHSN